MSAADKTPPAVKPKAAPKPTALSQPFWDAAQQGQLMLQVEPGTGHVQFFPRPFGLMGSGATQWQAAAGTGVLLAFTRCRVPAPGFEAEAPYTMGIVRLAESPRVLAQIVHAPDASLHVGMAVRLAWIARDAGPPLYVFEPI